MKAKSQTIIALTVILILTSCMKDEPLLVPYSGFIPEEAEEGLPISTASTEGLDPVKLEELYKTLSNEQLYPNIHSLLVMRNGKLVAEAYFKDPGDRERIHAVMSVTKSITSLVTGIAFDLGYLDTLNAPVSCYLPEMDGLDRGKQEITLHHLLTMETGLDFDNDVHTSEMIYCEGSSLDYVLSHPQIFAPGEDWYYGDGNPQLISGVISSVSGKRMEELAEEYLFQPLGIREYFWESHSDGLSLGGMGLWLRPRDMARIGQLMLNKGSWEGTALVSENWISLSTTRQAGHRDYGYYWLTNENISFWASGKGGQIIWIYPDKNLLVVVTSDSYSKSWLLSQGSYNSIFQDITNSIAD